MVEWEILWGDILLFCYFFYLFNTGSHLYIWLTNYFLFLLPTFSHSFINSNSTVSIFINSTVLLGFKFIFLNMFYLFCFG